MTNAFTIDLDLAGSIAPIMNRLHGHEIVETLHQTPSSALYRVRRAPDGGSVLLRTLRTDGTRIADIARFKHEYEVIRAVTSPHVLGVISVDEHPEDLVIVLEDFSGEDLATHLRARGPLDIPSFLDLALSIAQGLEDIHRLRILHGDIRPRNILVRPAEDDAPLAVKLLGFGVEAEITREHEAIYNPAVLADILPYVSPEKTGRMNRSVDAGSDLYSLGVVFYELLAGRPPFTADDPMELFHAHIAVLPPPLAELVPHVPPAIASIVHRLLRKTAEDRYHAASGLVADLLECRRRLAETGEIGDLVAGAHDSGELFKLHQKLYGRQHDIERLVAAFEDVLGGQREIVLVSGYSGIGKSSLVQEILKPLAREKGYYISGKYDQYNRDMPYSAILQAFEGLLRQLLSESESRLRRWRSAIREALGNNGQVVCEMLPSLVHIIGEQPPAPALGPIEAQNRFTLCFERFVSVFARSAHPLVLFLDDLQWMDAASLGLLRSILQSDQMESMFFCGAYRDNEVGPAHPFMRAREDLQARGVAVRDIVLTPLDLSHIIELISDSLKTPHCGALAEVVLRKTGGNPFFIKQFVRSLYDQGALVYVAGHGWQWNLRKIESLQYTANVVDLMASMLRRLPARTQDALKLAATIGNRFDLSMLATVSECGPDETYARLDGALKEGLVVVRGEQIHFAHDKVQEAAYSLIPITERPAVHLQIGRLLRARLTSGDRQGLFDVVGHLSSAAGLLTDLDERLGLVRLGLAAAEKAEESAAFAGALRYLTLGASMLPADAWDVHYELALVYATRTGVMQSLCDLHDAALATLEACYARARGRFDQTAVRRLIMNVQVLKNDLPAALDEGLAALRPFAIDLPAFPDDAALAAELAATLALLDQHFEAKIGPDPTARTDAAMIAALTELPTLQDQEIAALQDVMQEMFAPCYFLATNNFGITVMKMVQNSLRHGVSKHSLYAYINFGTYLCAIGDVDRGYLFGRAGVQLDHLHPDKKSQAMLNNMWGAFVQHWKEPYARYKESLLFGLQIGIETGQYIWAFYNTVNSNTNSLLRGTPLPEVLAESRSYLPMWRLDKFNAITWMVGAIGQIGHNLTQPVDEPHRLKGEWIDIAAVIAEARRINNRASLFFANFYQVILGVFQGAHLQTARLCDDTDPSIVGIASWHGNPAYHFYGGLAYAVAHDEVDPETAARFLGQVTAFAAKLDVWAAHCPVNLRHRALLLHAELRRLAGDATASALYDEAIAAASSGGYIQDEALADELCGRFYARLGRQTIARAYLTEAHRRYARWGADAVVARLEREWPQLLPREQTRRPGAPRDSVNVELDVRSVLKASQALSGEIVLPRLLERLLDIILENAGARRGVLVLREDEQLRIEAGRDLDDARPSILRGVALADSPDVPIDVVQYVARTEENVALADTPSEGPFSGDPYIRRHLPRSLLVAPIRFQGRPAGVIYLENTLAAGAFTPERVEMLRLLSAQAAISIENARLYGHLEEKVTQRTAELREAHERIVALGRAQQERQEQDLRDKQELIQRQQELIRVLGTPIIEVWDGILTVPIVGALDDTRALELTDNLLQRIVATRSRHAIIDLTGVDEIDDATAAHLVGIIRAVQLLGAQAIISGLSPPVARTIVELGIDISRMPTRSNLREALRSCIAPARARP
ncbi:AAA family ATPase [Nannocystis sp. RBIL2]|uniref:AAA family ATPase n=1 Tax=Nannocystis sp. RBIL2 TaxID=2996788 RepID=UPI00226FD616|nr:AAA family ATPase [Nannocystis sp. RBIL2]